MIGWTLMMAAILVTCAVIIIVNRVQAVQAIFENSGYRFVSAEQHSWLVKRYDTPQVFI